MKGNMFFQGEMITKKTKIHWQNLKKISEEPKDQFQPNLAQSILKCREFKFVQIKGQAIFQGEIITKYLKLHWQIF